MKRNAPPPRFEGEKVSHLYGIGPILEALRAGRRSIQAVIIAEGARHERLREIVEAARAAGVPVKRVPRSHLTHIVGPEINHQGAVAIVAAATYKSADELIDTLAAGIGSADPPLAVALDGVEDPRNLGAIIRTVDCVGAHGVFIPARRSAGLTETVAKASAGALDHVAVARAENMVRLIEMLKERNIWTVGTAAGAPLEYTSWDWTLPCVLFLGGEGAGLRRLVRERCDTLVGIPLRGSLSSLNVSVAAGVILYEAVRQRAQSCVV